MRCPVLSDFISKIQESQCLDDCNFNGVCRKGKCDCFYGWSEKSNCAERIPNANVLQETSFQENPDLKSKWFK